MAIIINRACKPRRRIRMERLSFWGTNIHTTFAKGGGRGRGKEREREREKTKNLFKSLHFGSAIRFFLNSAGQEGYFLFYNNEIFWREMLNARILLQRVSPDMNGSKRSQINMPNQL